MIKKIAVVVVFLISGPSVWSQIEKIPWQNCLGTEDSDNWTYAVESTINGYLFGIELDNDGPGVSNYHGKADAWIVNTDKQGNVIWERCYGGSGGDGPQKIIKIDENNFYLLNSSWSNDGDVQNGRAGNFWVVKIDSSGNIIWESSYGSDGMLGDEPRDAILMPDKGLLMMGRISSTGGDVTVHYGNMDVWLCRIDKAGGIIWQKTIGNEGKDNGLKVKLTSNNTILFIGGHEVTGGMIDCPDLGYYIDTDVWIVEMDLDGNFLNQWCYGGKYYDLGYDVFEADDGYVIAASTRSNDRDVSGFHGTPGEYASTDIWCFKIDFSGNMIWQKCLGGYSWEHPVYVTQTSDSGFIIIGNTNSYDGDVTGNHTPNGNGLDIWVVKLSHDGQLLWEHCFGSPLIDRFWGIHSVVKKGDYNYVVGANSIVADGDVTCDLFPDPFNSTYNAWIFEIKDCYYYDPALPVFSSGPDTVCTSVIPVSTYRLDSAAWAWSFEWVMEPQEAGTLYSDSLSATITWNTTFEGTVAIKARSYNDCGISAWSEPLLTFVYSGMGIGDDKTVGRYDDKKGGLEVWPNPAAEEIHVRWNMDDGRFYRDCELVIYDVFGRAVTASILSSPQVGGGREGGLNGEGEVTWQVDVSALPAGIYLAVVKDERDVMRSAKFIIAR